MNSSNTYTWKFWLLCLSSLLFFSSFTMMIPELPNYIESMGGGELKGFIYFVFTVAAGLSRPFSGKLSDTIGRVPVIIFGAVVCVLCGIVYPFANTIFAFLFLRFIHGMSTGFTPTGTSAYVADISTLKNRGEAIGIQGLCANIGAAIGPYFGSIIAAAYSIDAMFYASSGMALLSVLILLGLPETLTDKVGFTPKLLRLNRYELIEKRVLFPAIIMALLMFSFGVVITIIPDLSIYLGMEQKDKGLFYLYLTLASIAVRLFAGKASDKYGRAHILKISAFLLGFAMLGIYFVQTPNQLMGCAVLFGLATGIAAPTIFAWTIDLSLDKFRGKAMGTIYIALEIGVGMGALISGWIYGNKAENLQKVFLFASILSFIGLILLIIHTFRKSKIQKAKKQRELETV